MNRTTVRALQLTIDLAVLGTALLVSFLIRFEWHFPPLAFKRFVIDCPYVVGLEYVAMMGFGVPRSAWRYVGLRESVRILVAMSCATALMIGVRFAAPVFDWIYGYRYAQIPVGVSIINFSLGYIGITGVRIVRRLIGERVEFSSRAAGSAMTRTVLVGAGQAGLVVAKEINGRPDLGMTTVGFLDDDVRKLGAVIHGIPVVGTTNELEAVCRRLGAERILITVANAPGGEIRRIKSLCDRAGIPAKIIPGIYEIVGSNINLSKIRDVTIEDLLRRAPVELETSAISDAVANETVLVTGAGGSIGSELCRQLCRFRPLHLVLVERSENALFGVHRELCAAFPGLADSIVPCIGDVCDSDRIDEIFAAWRPSMVFHAAAHKHVPMMERNAVEALKNNVLGTRVVARAANTLGAREFVFISTDKAVNPTSVMGLSKRLAEIYVQALSRKSSTCRYVTVRFGNVLGSAGSVIPIFKEQIAAGGPVTVTHPEMKRYFMTIPEACQLVLQAATLGEGGEIFILDMGEPVRIVDLARDLVRLSGLRPDSDIPIVITGTRPGEKLFEELSVAEESAAKTRHPKIYIGRIQAHDLETVEEKIGALRHAIQVHDDASVGNLCRELVPEYSGELGRADSANGTRREDVVCGEADHAGLAAILRVPATP